MALSTVGKTLGAMLIGASALSYSAKAQEKDLRRVDIAENIQKAKSYNPNIDTNNPEVYCRLAVLFSDMFLEIHKSGKENLGDNRPMAIELPTSDEGLIKCVNEGISNKYKGLEFIKSIDGLYVLNVK